MLKTFFRRHSPTAWRRVGAFEYRGQGSFASWLRTIARRRVIDHVRRNGRVKRGGQRRVTARLNGRASSSAVQLFQLLTSNVETPSTTAATKEAVRHLFGALEHLEGDYRRVLQLRYLESMPVSTVARIMQRTDAAIHMLCNRALKKLRKTMGSSSKYV